MYTSDLMKLFLTCRQRNVKSLMKTLRLHIIVIESSQYMFSHYK